VQDHTIKLWQELCEQAAKEKDPQKLLELIKRLNALLMEAESQIIEELCKSMPHEVPKQRKT